MPEDQFEAEVRMYCTRQTLATKQSRSRPNAPHKHSGPKTLSRSTSKPGKRRRGRSSGFYFKNTDTIRDLIDLKT